MRYMGGVHLAKPQDYGVFECFYDEKGKMSGGFLCICSKVCHIKTGDELCGYVVRRFQEEVRQMLQIGRNKDCGRLLKEIRRKLENSRKEIRAVASFGQGYCVGAVWLADEGYLFAEGGIGIFVINNLYGKWRIAELYERKEESRSYDVRMQCGIGVLMVKSMHLPVLKETEAAGCLFGSKGEQREDIARRIREVGNLLEESIALLIVEE